MRGDRITLALCLLLICCDPERPETGDLGSFFLGDSIPPDTAFTDSQVTGEWGVCYSPAESETELSVVGQLFEMSFENMFPGAYVGNVAVDVIDACGAKVQSFEVGQIGSFATHFPVGQGFDGYFEYPYKPESVLDEEYPFLDYPLFREFDKPFAGDYIHVNLRIFAPNIIAIPLAFMKQKPELGYIQATLYEWITYETIEGASVETSSGEVCYISEGSLPDLTLTKTCSRGLFLVANATPGPVTLTVTLPNGSQVTRTVLAWPLDSHPTKVITNVGFAVHPLKL